MASQGMQSNSNESISNVLGRLFRIEPEHLVLEEVQHELLIRGVSVNGDRRTLTAELRRCIIEEERNPRARRLYEVGIPQEEFEYCNRNVSRLQGLLDNVNEDLSTHERFMSVMLHLHGRLVRIPSTSELDLSPVMYSVRKEYTAIHEGFIEKVQTYLQRQRSRRAMQDQNVQRNGLPNIEAVDIPIDRTTTNNVSTNETNGTGTTPRISNASNEANETNATPMTASSNPSSQQLDHITISSSVENDRASNAIDNNRVSEVNAHGNNYSPNNQLELHEPNNAASATAHNIREPRINRSADNRISENEARANVPFVPNQIFRDLSVMQMVEALEDRLSRMPMGTHATMHPNDLARLSQHFNRLSEEVIAPIHNRSSIIPSISVPSQFRITI